MKPRPKSPPAAADYSADAKTPSPAAGASSSSQSQSQGQSQSQSQPAPRSPTRSSTAAAAAAAGSSITGSPRTPKHASPSRRVHWSPSVEERLYGRQVAFSAVPADGPALGLALPICGKEGCDGCEQCRRVVPMNAESINVYPGADVKALAVSTRRRLLKAAKAMLPPADLQRLEQENKAIRESREHVMCQCEKGCRPETCICIQNGIGCHQDPDGCFCASAITGCHNPNPSTFLNEDLVHQRYAEVLGAEFIRKLQEEADQEEDDDDDEEEDDEDEDDDTSEDGEAMAENSVNQPLSRTRGQQKQHQVQEELAGPPRHSHTKTALQPQNSTTPAAASTDSVSHINKNRKNAAEAAGATPAAAPGSSEASTLKISGRKSLHVSADHGTGQSPSNFLDRVLMHGLEMFAASAGSSGSNGGASSTSNPPAPAAAMPGQPSRKQRGRRILIDAPSQAEHEGDTGTLPAAPAPGGRTATPGRPLSAASKKTDATTKDEQTASKRHKAESTEHSEEAGLHDNKAHRGHSRRSSSGSSGNSHSGTGLDHDEKAKSSAASTIPLPSFTRSPDRPAKVSHLRDEIPPSPLRHMRGTTVEVSAGQGVGDLSTGQSFSGSKSTGTVPVPQFLPAVQIGSSSPLATTDKGSPTHRGQRASSTRSASPPSSPAETRSQRRIAASHDNVSSAGEAGSSKLPPVSKVPEDGSSVAHKRVPTPDLSEAKGDGNPQSQKRRHSARASASPPDSPERYNLRVPGRELRSSRSPSPLRGTVKADDPVELSAKRRKSGQASG